MEGSDGDDGSEDGSEDEGMGAAAAWKAQMLERAAALFSTRGADLHSYIYGTRATADVRQGGGGRGKGREGGQPPLPIVPSTASGWQPAGAASAGPSWLSLSSPPAFCLRLSLHTLPVTASSRPCDLPCLPALTPTGLPPPPAERRVRHSRRQQTAVQAAVQAATTTMSYSGRGACSRQVGRVCCCAALCCAVLCCAQEGRMSSDWCRPPLHL
jgi:hypothetical protein